MKTILRLVAFDNIPASKIEAAKTEVRKILGEKLEPYIEGIKEPTIDQATEITVMLHAFFGCVTVWEKKVPNLLDKALGHV